MSKLVFLLLGLIAAVLAAPSDDGSMESVEMIRGDEDLESVELIREEEDDEVRGLVNNSKGEHRCSCATGNSCECCARPRIPLYGKLEGCMKVTLNTEEKQMEVQVTAQGSTLISKKVSTAATERICDRLPGAMHGTKICLYTTTSDLPDKSGVQSCPKIDVMQETKIVAKLIFACVQFKDEKLSLNDNGDVKANDLFKIKSGNPIKGVLNWLGLREPSHKE